MGCAMYYLYPPSQFLDGSLYRCQMKKLIQRAKKSEKICPKSQMYPAAKNVEEKSLCVNWYGVLAVKKG